MKRPSCHRRELRQRLPSAPSPPAPPSPNSPALPPSPPWPPSPTGPAITAESFGSGCRRPHHHRLRRPRIARRCRRHRPGPPAHRALADVRRSALRPLAGRYPAGSRTGSGRRCHRWPACLRRRTARWPTFDDRLCARWQVGIQPGAEPDQAVGGFGRSWPAGLRSWLSRFIEGLGGAGPTPCMAFAEVRRRSRQALAAVGQQACAVGCRASSRVWAEPGPPRVWRLRRRPRDGRRFRRLWTLRPSS